MLILKYSYASIVIFSLSFTVSCALGTMAICLFVIDLSPARNPFDLDIADRGYLLHNKKLCGCPFGITDNVPCCVPRIIVPASGSSSLSHLSAEG